MSPWLLLATACDTGSDRAGTFVGNPGGNDQLAVASAGTTGVVSGDGTARLREVVLTACETGRTEQVDPATFPPEGLIQLSTERALTGIELPEGEWCSMIVGLTEVVLDFQLAEGSIHLETSELRILLDAGDPLAIDPQTTSDRKAEVSLVLADPEWLLALADAELPPGGVIRPDAAQQQELEGRMAQASTLYDGEGRVALHGSGYSPAAPPECEAGPTPALREVIRDCPSEQGYEVNSFVSEDTCEPGLWIAGIYEARSDHSGEVHPSGEVTVTFDVPGEQVLALSSYEPVTWNVRVGPDTRLRTLLVAGYHEQVVRGTDVPVQRVVGPVCGYSWPYNGEGCNTDALIEGFESAVGLRTTRFDGCYRATEMGWELP